MNVYLSACGQWAFIQDGPAKPHRYLRVPSVVITTACDFCGARRMSPCLDKDGAPKTSVHAMRRERRR